LAIVKYNNIEIRNNRKYEENNARSKLIIGSTRIVNRKLEEKCLKQIINALINAIITGR
jgi:hypothetical protein